MARCPVRPYRWEVPEGKIPVGPAVPERLGRADASKDWVRRPSAFVIWWGLPIVLGVCSGFLKLPPAQAALLWAALFAWMGTGCLLNALRCARLHCFISGPVLWLGAIASGLVGLGVISTRHVLADVIDVTAVLVVLSCVPEWLRGKFRPGT
jgi:hypothetical protein